MGTCNGVLSSCALGGYAMESRCVPTSALSHFFVVLFIVRSDIFHRCHLGKSIVYDTVSNLSWGVDIRTHTIGTVIEKLLSDPWPPSEELGREVPEPVTEDDCVASELRRFYPRSSVLMF